MYLNGKINLNFIKSKQKLKNFKQKSHLNYKFNKKKKNA